jgi:hypothetical protein
VRSDGLAGRNIEVRQAQALDPMLGSREDSNLQAAGLHATTLGADIWFTAGPRVLILRTLEESIMGNHRLHAAELYRP